MFELLVVDGKALSSRVLHQKETHYLRSFKSGLESTLTEAFQGLLDHGVSRMEIKTTLIPGAHNFDQLITISDETLIWMNPRFSWFSRIYSFEGIKELDQVYAEFLGSLSPVIGLLTWRFASSQERFQAGKFRSVSRVCILCKETQVRERSAPQPNVSLSQDWGWPSGCLNSECFSHEIERTIDPDYRLPEFLRKEPLNAMHEAVRVAAQPLSGAKR